MEPLLLFRAILPDVLIDNFDVVNFEKGDTRFDTWLDEKKVQMRDDKRDLSVIPHGFGDYRTIQDYPIRGRVTYLHVRKRKWLDKATGEIFKHANEEKQLVWGLFGLQDKNVNCQPDFRKHYGATHFIAYQGEHYLNDTVLKKTVFPLVKQLLQLT